MGPGRFLLDRFRRLVGFARARSMLRECELGSRVCVDGDVRVETKGGRIAIGSLAVFVGGLQPTELIGAPRATIAIGEETVVNYGTRIDSNGGDIMVGARCLLASGVRLLAAQGAPIHIERDVWIAHGAVVEAGVTIGAGSVVAAAAVVTRDVPPRSLAIGNPARAMALDFVTREKRLGKLP